MKLSMYIWLPLYIFGVMTSYFFGYHKGEQHAYKLPDGVWAKVINSPQAQEYLKEKPIEIYKKGDAKDLCDDMRVYYH